MNIKIRKATKSDVLEICRLHDLLVEENQILEAIYPPETNALEINKNIFLEQIKSKNSYLLVAETNKIILGYLLIQKRNHLIAHIRDIYVDSGRRKKGIGSALVNYGIKWVKENNIKNLDLFTGSRNTASLKMWNKLGFKEDMKRMKMVL